MKIIRRKVGGVCRSLILSALLATIYLRTFCAHMLKLKEKSARNVNRE